MNSDTIFPLLLSAARFLKEPLQEVAVEPLKDAYTAMRAYLQKKLGNNSDASRSLDAALEKPDSEGRKAVLLEEAAGIDWGDDKELERLARRLRSLLPKGTKTVRQTVRVTGRGNTVEVAGRDIIKSERHVRRNIIQPDGRHLSAEQKARLKPVIDEVAYRLGGEDGTGNWPAVYSMLERRFGVTSYLLIPREEGEAAIAFLKQQRAINRHRLRRRNPDAYASDLFRAIYAQSAKLGWDKPQLYAYAREKLNLKRPIGSLRLLGPIQLKSLAEYVRREVTKFERSATIDPWVPA